VGNLIGKNIFAILLAIILLVGLSKADVYVSPEIYKELEENGNAKVIVLLKEPYDSGVGISSFNIRAARKTSQNTVISRVQNKFQVRHRNELVNSFSGLAASDAFEILLKDPNVKGIYYDFPVQSFLQDSVHIVGAPGFWGINLSGYITNGSGQTVCVIDTGIDYTHSSLGGCFGPGCKVIGGYDFVNDDADPMEDEGHGTHVAGIVSSSHATYRGVAPGARLVAIKSLDSTGEGQYQMLRQALNGVLPILIV
jgi:subtilisin family serine protease